MSHQNFNKHFSVNYDVSELGLGALFYQEQEGQLKVISYASHKLSSAEKNYYVHSGKF